MVGRPRSYGVNDNFFDQESKAMWYILGITFAKGILVNHPKKIEWQTTSKPLLEIVNSSLGSEYPIHSRDYTHVREGEDDFTMYKLLISSPRLYEALSVSGLDVPKKERRFPSDIEEQYLDHFVRGVFDAQVSCTNSLQRYGKNDEYARHDQRLITGRFGIPFLQDLYETLVQYAHVRSGKLISKPPLSLSGSDVRKVYEFLYRDWAFIEANGLYLPSKKERFEVKYNIKNPPKEPREPNKDEAEKHNRAIDLLREGKSVSEVAKLLGFVSIMSFSNSFKGFVGKCPSEFKLKD